MNKKEFIEIEMPNGSKVTAIVIETIADYLLCYAQNRLFLVSPTKYLERIIVEYCIIPEYDQLLLEYYSKYIIDLIMNYGYTKEEAINILDGKNSDGSEFIQLPF